jgi:Sec-independent protein translocase protein TatA
MKYVLWAIGLYILYQFIFKLVIPVFIASRKIKKGFREMQSRMQEQMQQQQQQQSGYTQQAEASQPETKFKSGDYIEFEEVK